MAEIYSKSSFEPDVNIDRKNNVTIIDPNPYGEIVPLEDLFIYVRLRANQRQKTLLTETDNNQFNVESRPANSVDIGVPQKATVINGSTLFNSKSFLTTDWTEIGGNKIDTAIDYEGFSITNIDIEIKSQTTPKVVIDFVDIRGATLFEQGSCSPYGLFFNLPYPIFELTVKGYYGKAVNYYLNMVKFNARFNSETGNMECRAEFIGYSFAFLSDTIVSFVTASQYLPGSYNAQGILKQKYEDTVNFYVNNLGLDVKNVWCNNSQTPGCTTIYNLLNSIKLFDQNEKPKIANSVEYQELNDLIELNRLYTEYKSVINDCIKELKDKKYTPDYTTSTGKNKGIKVKFKFTPQQIGTEVTTGTLFNYFNTNTNNNGGKILNAISSILKAKVGDLHSYELKDSNNNNISCGVNNPSQFNSTQKNYSLFNNSFFKNFTQNPWFSIALQSLGYGTGVNKSEIFIDFGYILDDIDRELDILNKKPSSKEDNDQGILTKKRRDVIEAINKIVSDKIGFNPTIRNIFTVLLCNTDAFMEILLKVSQNAQTDHESNNSTLIKYQGQSEPTVILSGENKVYPWPTVSQKDYDGKSQGEKEIYPGLVFPDWVEVKFVEDFLKAFLDFKNALDVLNGNTEDKPGFDNYVPINPLESRIWPDITDTGIKYFSGDAGGTSVGGKDEIYKIIGERLFLSLDHSLFQEIRQTPDSKLIPKVDAATLPSKLNTGKWLDTIKKLGEVEACNLISTIDKPENLDAFTENTFDSFNQAIKEQLKKFTFNDNIMGSTIKKDGVSNVGENEKYYSYITDKDKGILIKKSQNGEVWVHPNPFKMDPKYLIQIIPEDQIGTSKITLNSDNEIQKLTIDTRNAYKDSLLTSTKDVNFSTTSFQPNNSDLTTKKAYPSFVTFDEDQNLISFEAGQLYTTLAMVTPENKYSVWWTDENGDLSKQTKDQEQLGSIVSNMGMMTYWDSLGNNETRWISLIKNKEISSAAIATTVGAGIVAGVVSVASAGTLGPEAAIAFTAIAVKNGLYKDSDSVSNRILTDLGQNPPKEIKLESPDGSGTGAETITESIQNIATPLVTTPMWLDNVNEFRRKARGDDFKLDENIQNANLAYLFLHTLKSTPLVTRLINDDGYFYYPYTQNNGNKYDSSSIWSLRAFNTVGGVSKVPKAWVLNLGSELWRWREFVGTKTINGKTYWNKPLTCVKCSAGDIPTGNDPLIQPGYDSWDLITRSGNKGNDFRNNPKNYLEYIYGGTYGTNYNSLKNTKPYQSVFSHNTQGVEAGQIINGLGVPGNQGDWVFFKYFSLYQDKIGYLSPYIISGGTDSDFVYATENYSWPQVYIAPHHLPYVSPDVFDDPNASNSGDGADFVFVTDDWVGDQDYQTIMPERREATGTNDYYYEGSQNITQAPTRGGSKRSKEYDGNLGMIIQYLPDSVKDMFVDEFLRWTNGDWKEILKIVDPVNFNNDNLTSQYSYQKGDNTPARIIDKAFSDSDNTVLTLNPDISQLSSLLTSKYWILNSTPKIWYGYGDDQNPNSSTSNQFYDAGFIVSETQWNTYLNAFYTKYQLLKDKKKQELVKKEVDDNPLAETLSEDGDVKLSLYRTFKSLSDKWISSSQNGKLFFNVINSPSKNCGQITTNEDIPVRTTLASHFQYVNRVMGDIGDLSVIDITKLKELQDNLTISLYQYLADLLVENEYLFFPLPTYVNFGSRGVGGSEKDLKDMFKPSLLDITDISCGPLFMCMYVGGSSRQLKFKGAHNCKIEQDILNHLADDSFSFDDANKPEDIASPNNMNPKSDGYVAFKVLYGVQNQNHFKNIQLDQSEFSETNESLLVIDKLAQQGGTDRTTKGQNLNAAYLTRSYTCTIESMGNMMIQPMTYFDLQGVPMFAGAYLITEVRHNIKPNNASTTFKGVRQPRATVPLVTDAATAMNISFKGVKAGPKTRITNTQKTTTNNNASNPNNITSPDNTKITATESLDGAWRQQINPTTKNNGTIKSDTTREELIKIIQNEVEGGYYHPVFWYNPKQGNKGTKNNYGLYDNSGETMFGEDRAAGSTENTPDGIEFWSIIDKLSGYGNYGTLQPIAAGNGTPSDNYSRNHKTNPTKNGIPWDQNYLQDLLDNVLNKNKGWKFGEKAPNTVEGDRLKELSAKIGLESTDKLLKSNFKDNQELIDKITGDTRLYFCFVRARYNGPGFFQDFANSLKEKSDLNPSLTAEELIPDHLDFKWTYAANSDVKCGKVSCKVKKKNDKTITLLRNDVLKIAEIIGWPRTTYVA